MPAPGRRLPACRTDSSATTGSGGEVINRCRKADDRIDEGSGSAKLRVSFFWPFCRDYWVLSRTPQMDEAQLQALLDRAAALGFDRQAFLRTP